MTEFCHISYGFRLDGTIGPEEPGNPVALYALIPTDEDEASSPPWYLWSDNQCGPVRRPGESENNAEKA